MRADSKDAGASVGPCDRRVRRLEQRLGPIHEARPLLGDGELFTGAVAQASKQKRDGVAGGAGSVDDCYAKHADAATVRNIDP